MEIVNHLFEDKNTDLETRKTNNLSDKVISTELINEIETIGVSLEQLEKLNEQGFPILKYQTQITIHGITSKLDNQRIFGYKNLFLNGNQTLGIRYNAIDGKKKNIIQYCINKTYNENKSNFKFYHKRDSVGDTLNCIIRFTDDNEKEQLEFATNFYNSIPKELFIGKKFGAIMSEYGRKFIWISIVLNGIYEKNLWKFISFITNNLIDENKYKELIKNDIIKEEEYTKQREEKSNKTKEEYNNWKSEIDNKTPKNWIKIKPKQKFVEGDTLIRIGKSTQTISVYQFVKNPENNRTSYYAKTYKTIDEIDTNKVDITDKVLKNVVKIYHENLEDYLFIDKKKETKIKTIKVEEKKIEQTTNSEVEIKHNENKNGIEIYFTSKPEQLILNILKEKGFRWMPAKNSYNGKNYWYKRYTEELINEVKLLLNTK